MQPTLVFLPGKFHGQRSLVGYEVAESWAQLSMYVQKYEQSKLFLNIFQASSIKGNKTKKTKLLQIL